MINFALFSTQYCAGWWSRGKFTTDRSVGISTGVNKKNKTRTNVTAPEGRKVGRGSYAEVTAAAAASLKSSRGDCKPAPGVFGLNHGKNSDEIREHKPDFHLLYEQLMRMNRQLRQLFDVRDQRRLLGPCVCR